MTRKRVWLLSPNHNYTDKKKYLITKDNYQDFVVYEEENTHFNHGDFVNCQCVSIAPVVMLNNLPNYLLIFNGSEIESRYFVLGYEYISGEPAANKSKFNVSLKRDVIVDFKSYVDSNLHRVKRGQLNPSQYSPVLVQPEGLIFNEVKQAQVDIRAWDADTQWLTIFYDPYADVSARTITFDNSSVVEASVPFATVQADFASRGWSLTSTGGTFNLSRSWTEMSKGMWINNGRTTSQGSSSNTFRGYINSSTGFRYDGWTINGSVWDRVDLESAFRDRIMTGQLMSSSKPKPNITTIQNSATSQFNYDYSSNYAYLRNKYDGVLMSISGGVVRIQFQDTGALEETVANTAVNNSWNGQFVTTSTSTSSDDIFYLSNWTSAYIKSMGVTDNVYINTRTNRFQVTFGPAVSSGSMVLPNNVVLDEVNLGCVTIPFGNNTKLVNSGTTYELSVSSIKTLATSGWTKAGTAIKDIQILPYCPQADMNSTYSSSAPSNTINITPLVASRKVVMTNVTSGGTTVTQYYGIACSQSSVDYRFNVDLSAYLNSNLKIQSMTQKVRLCSHNHKAAFEFNPALNNGLTQVSFSYTMRPFNTIFRICPIFNTGALYGGNYKDARGLIWEGGFSLPQVTDAWVEYKLQNSTYEAVFNREIQNQEITNTAARNLETLNMNTDYKNSMIQISAQETKAAISVAGGLISAGAGLASGNPMALVGGAGALLGGAGAAVSAQASRDVANNNLAAARDAQKINDTTRAESIAYKSDMFELTNAAIQSRPNTLATGTDYSQINNTKAYFEVYTCTDEELSYITNYLRYHGMKIDRIDNPTNYLIGDMCYLESIMLFCEGLTPTIANAINAELVNGIYVQEGLFS